MKLQTVLLFIVILFSITSCRKYEEIKYTKVEGNVKRSDGSTAIGVYVNIIQRIIPNDSKKNKTNIDGFFLIQQLETNENGEFEYKFKAEKQREGFKGNYDDYFIVFTSTRTSDIKFENELPKPISLNYSIKRDGKLRMGFKNNFKIEVK
jgi:hypothetical protein